jgi:nicotinamide mononucleotide transporter
MIWLIDESSVLFEFQGYFVSPIEAFGVGTAFLSVWLAIRNSIHTWTVNTLSVVSFFCLFYQVNLYSDMLLQVFFFVTNILGIISWKRGHPNISKIPSKNLFLHFLLAVFLSLILGFFVSKIHLLLPEVFLESASFPFLDSLKAVFSVFATVLLIKRKVECWWFWIAVNCISVYLYSSKSLHITSLEYFMFLVMAIYGLYRWNLKIEVHGKPN